MQNWEEMCEICPWQSSTSMEVLIPAPPPRCAVDLRASFHTKSGVQGTIEAGAMNLTAMNTFIIFKDMGLDKDGGEREGADRGVFKAQTMI